MGNWVSSVSTAPTTSTNPSAPTASTNPSAPTSRTASTAPNAPTTRTTPTASTAEEFKAAKLFEIKIDSRVPTFTSLDELLTTKSDAIIQYATLYPNDDVVVLLAVSNAMYVFSSPVVYRDLASCVAGSAAVRQLQTRLAERARQLGLDEKTVFRSARMRECAGWSPGDCDVFVLNQERPARFKLLQTDVVHVPERSVSDLLLGFDLPCCRAAVDVQGGIWCSLHCLASLFAGTYALPKLLTSTEGCIELIRYAHAQYQKPCANVGVRRSEEDKLLDAQFIYKHTKERAAKYAHERGIVPTYVEDLLVPRWVYLRFVRRFQDYVPDPKKQDESKNISS